MKIVKPILISVSILLLIILGFLYFTKSNLKVIKAESESRYKGYYPKDCYIKFDNKDFLIRDVYVYKNKILNEVWFVAAEGFAVVKTGVLGENLANEDKTYRFLNYSTDKSYVVFNSKKHKIDYQNSDTFVSKINDKEIILFIDTK